MNETTWEAPGARTNVKVVFLGAKACPEFACPSGPALFQMLTVMDFFWVLTKVLV